MKVLRVIGGVDPAWGGPSVSCINSCIAAARAGIETTLATPIYDGDDDAAGPLLDRLAAAGVEVRKFPGRAAAGSLAKRWGVNWPMARWFLAARRHYDIVHCHTAWQLTTLAALLPSPFFGRRAGRVLTPHECLTAYDIDQTSGRVSGAAKRLLKPLLVRGYDRLVMSSPLEARDSLRPGDRGAVVYHPVYDERDHAPVQRQGREHGGLRIGFLGRLHPKKNLDLLIEALAHLPQSVTLCVAGDGPDTIKQTLRARADALGIAGRIDWRGFVAPPDKPDFFARIDLLAMPSAYECFGMSAAEALVAGVPVLVSRETGVAEIVRKSGAGLVVEADVAALAEALGGLAAAPDRLAAMSDQAPVAGKAFSFAAHGEGLRRLYSEIARGAEGTA